MNLEHTDIYTRAIQFSPCLREYQRMSVNRSIIQPTYQWMTERESRQACFSKRGREVCSDRWSEKERVSELKGEWNSAHACLSIETRLQSDFKVAAIFDVTKWRAHNRFPFAIFPGPFSLIPFPPDQPTLSCTPLLPSPCNQPSHSIRHQQLRCFSPSI